MKKKKLKKKAKIIIIAIIIVLLAGLSGTYIYIYNKNKNEELIKIKNEEERKKTIESNYSTHVITNKKSILYELKDKKFIKTDNFVTKDIQLELEEIDVKTYKENYIKIKNIDYYISYKDIVKDTDFKETIKDHRYKNYIPFNENVVLKDKYKLFVANDIYYELDDELSLPILIKDTDKYYIEYDNKLVYINKEDANYSIIENHNSDTPITTHFAIINYHYIVAPDDTSCSSTLCHPFEQFDSHLKFLHDEEYFSINMQELEWFMDKKIQLSKKTVAITVDDGWYASNVPQFLDKYNMTATLFLITSLTSKETAETDNFEVHSHGHDIHNVGECDVAGTRGGGILCREKSALLEDLRKSREILNNTTVFCYPFYEFNDYAISTLKEAGFTIALAGGGRDVRQDDDKFKIPRYGITSNTDVEGIRRIVTVN